MKEEAERKKMKMDVGGGVPVNIFLRIQIFSRGVEKFTVKGVEVRFYSEGLEIFREGLRNFFRGLRNFFGGVEKFLLGGFTFFQ